jgi:hypothetical protein
MAFLRFHFGASSIPCFVAGATPCHQLPVFDASVWARFYVNETTGF